MNPFEMVVFIVAIVMIGSVLRALFQGPRHPVNFQGPDPQAKAETQRLRDEVTQLKDRVKVLERIAIEKEDLLSKQIEELRES